jgi:hypothetical protein
MTYIYESNSFSGKTPVEHKETKKSRVFSEIVFFLVTQTPDYETPCFTSRANLFRLDFDFVNDKALLEQEKSIKSPIVSIPYEWMTRLFSKNQNPHELVHKERIDPMCQSNLVDSEVFLHDHSLNYGMRGVSDEYLDVP